MPTYSMSSDPAPTMAMVAVQSTILKKRKQKPRRAPLLERKDTREGWCVSVADVPFPCHGTQTATVKVHSKGNGCYIGLVESKTVFANYSKDGGWFPQGKGGWALCSDGDGRHNRRRCYH